MAQFTIYRSTDPSAPVLNGLSPTLVTVLDAILVNGYGSKTAAGWTKAFSGTSKAAYLMGSGAIQHYLRVQDDGPNNQGEARCTGYETMSNVDTGTNPFPTAAQGLGGSVAAVVLRKSSGGTSPWVAFADARTLYFFCQPGDVAGAYCGFMFGEVYSLLTATDSYRTCIIGRTQEAVGSNTNEGMQTTSAVNAATIGHFLSRSYTAAVGSVTAGKHGDAAKVGTLTAIGPGLVPFPNPEDSGLYLSPFWIHENGTGNLRARLRGLWQFVHPLASLNDGDTAAGLGDLAGKTFVFVKLSPNNSIYAVETSNTVETN